MSARGNRRSFTGSLFDESLQAAAFPRQCFSGRLSADDLCNDDFCALIARLPGPDFGLFMNDSVSAIIATGKLARTLFHDTSLSFTDHC